MSSTPPKKGKSEESVGDEKGSGSSHIYEIPDSILEILFHWLAFYEVCRNSRVSKRHRSLCASSLRLRKTASLNKCDRNQAALAIAKNCNRITTLVIWEDHDYVVNEHCLRSVLDNNPHMSTISAQHISSGTGMILEKAPYSHISIDELVVFIPNPKRANYSRNRIGRITEAIARTPNSIKRLNNEGHWSQAYKCPNLEVLIIYPVAYGRVILTDLSELAQSCRKLKTLCIQGHGVQMDFSSLVSLEELVFETPVNVTGLASLVRLKTIETDPFGIEHPVSGFDIGLYVEQFIQAPNLRNLRVCLNSWEELQIILEGCANLRNLCTKFHKKSEETRTPDDAVKLLAAKGIRSASLVSCTLLTQIIASDGACGDVLLVAPNLKYLRVDKKVTKFGVVPWEILASPWATDRIEILTGFRWPDIHSRFEY